MLPQLFDVAIQKCDADIQESVFFPSSTHIPAPVKTLHTLIISHIESSRYIQISYSMFYDYIHQGTAILALLLHQDL